MSANTICLEVPVMQGGHTFTNKQPTSKDLKILRPPLLTPLLLRLRDVSVQGITRSVQALWFL